jgi:hypothetical protein
MRYLDQRAGDSKGMVQEFGCAAIYHRLRSNRSGDCLETIALCPLLRSISDMALDGT